MTAALPLDLVEQAADLISPADALIVTAGAGHALAEIDRVMRSSGNQTT